MHIEIQYIQDGVSCAVLPTANKMARNLSYAKQAGLDTEELIKANNEFMERAEASGKLQVRSFEVSPYTYGQKIEAARRATQMNGMERVMDNNLLNLELICASTGLAKKEVEDLPMQIAQALFDEVQFISEPDPERLLFLSPSPTDGAVKAPTKKKQS